LKVSESQVRVDRAVRPVQETLAARPGHVTLGKFVLVGGLGYLIYQVCLFVMYDSPLLAFLAAKGRDISLGPLRHSDALLLITSLVAAELSIIGVFLGHHHWTFRNRELVDKPLWLRFLQFNLKAAVSSMGIVTLLLNVLVLRLGLYHFVALPLAVIAGFFWNWLWDAQYIWRRTKQQHGAD